MVEADVERIYTIPLREPKQGKRSHRAPRALSAIRSYLVRHLKSEKVWIDAAVNEKIWERGKFKIPSKIRVRAIKFQDGVVEVSLPEEEAKNLRDQLKAKRDAAAGEAILAPTEGAEAAEEGAAAPTEVAPEAKPEEKVAAEKGSQEGAPEKGAESPKAKGKGSEAPEGEKE